MSYKFRRFENLHIFFWLVKDACWVTDFKPLGVAMIFPTILIAIYITWKMRQELSELVHNLAVTLWICANSTWMIGEFYYEDTTRPYAKIFFFSGLAIISVFYLWRLVQWSKAFRARKSENPAAGSSTLP